MYWEFRTSEGTMATLNQHRNKNRVGIRLFFYQLLGGAMSK